MTNLNFFANCSTPEAARKQYYQLAKIYHSDVEGGSTEMMQILNDQYAAFIGKSKAEEETNDIPNLPEGVLPLPEHLPEQPMAETQAFMDIISVLVKLPNINVELCGCWVWVSGDTKPVKDKLSAAGCRFSGNKKMWYWTPEVFRGTYRRGGTSMERIRSKYGSRTIKRQED